MKIEEQECAGKTSVLVVDDHPLVCEGLSDLIGRQRDMVCCGWATSLFEAERAMVMQRPEVVLLDLRLGNADGLESIKALRARFEGLAILVLSQFDEAVYAERALRAGALGYVMKEQAAEEVLQAIRTVRTGQVYVSEKVGLMALMRILEEKPNPSVRGSDIHSLTNRELYVFEAIGSGKSNKQTATELKLSVKTVETYREHIKFKLGLSSGEELATRASQWLRGQLPLPEHRALPPEVLITRAVAGLEHQRRS